jgi:DNA invertase Pin-like site-specific DNA recombinase
MQIIQYFTTKGINVTSQKKAFTKTADHKENPIAKLMIGILVALAEFELSRIKERKAKERANAKKKLTYAVL